MKKKEINLKIVNFIILFSLFLIGIVGSENYGLTIDDEHYRINGLYFYEYIKKGLLGLNIQLVESDIKYSPALFEILLAFISDILNINKINEIYLLSHKLNFIIFFLSLIAFYKLIEKHYNSEALGILAVIFIFTTPRIFAESFYNSRDIFFMSLFIFNICSIYNFLSKRSLISILVMSVSTAILINSKVFGVVPLLIFTFFYIIENKNKNELRKRISDLSKILLFSLIFIYLLWPYLWKNPIENFIYSNFYHLTEQNKISVITYYFGEHINSNGAPWHYRIVWIFITIPTYILIFFITGFILNSKNYLQKLFILNEKENKLTKNLDQLFKIILFSIFVIIVFGTVKFNPSKLNGWRHLYFLYPIIIILSIDGLNFVYKIFRNIYLKNIIFIVCLINILYISIWSITNHPHQYVFFNFLTKNYSVNNFDLDYWGVSNLEAINFILEKTADKKIKVGTMSFSSLYESTLKLDEKKRKRIEITNDLNGADFIINTNMKRLRNNFIIDNNKYIKVFEIMINNKSINTVYKKI